MNFLNQIIVNRTPLINTITIYFRKIKSLITGIFHGIPLKKHCNNQYVLLKRSKRSLPPVHSVMLNMMVQETGFDKV